jgi:hypothetical protein
METNSGVQNTTFVMLQYVFLSCIHAIYIQYTHIYIYIYICILFVVCSVLLSFIQTYSTRPAVKLLYTVTCLPKCCQNLSICEECLCTGW